MIELFGLLLDALIDALRSRERLLLENLLLRQQLQVALRNRCVPRLRTRDKLFWLLVRRLQRDWRRHLLLVRPETEPRTGQPPKWPERGWRGKCASSGWAAGMASAAAGGGGSGR
jgi:hypothetical protein